LFIFDFTFNREQVDLLVNAVLHSQVRNVILIGVTIDHQDQHLISRLIKDSTNLQEFIFRCDNGMSPNCVRSIAEALQTNQTLQKLSLSNNQLGDDAIDPLAQALAVNSALKEIDLTDNNISKEKTVELFLRVNTKNPKLLIKQIYQLSNHDSRAVYLSTFNGKLEAVKLIWREENVAAAQQEYSIMEFFTSIQAPNIVCLYGLNTNFNFPDSYQFSMEYMINDSLSHAIKHKHPRISSLKGKWSAMKEITQGLSAIHSNGYLHRDMKSSNVLIAQDGTLKISDFGCAIKITKATAHFCGTFSYASPEAHQRQKQTTKSDVYSTGMIFWELIAETKTPFSYVEDKEKLKHEIVDKKSRPPIPVGTTVKISQLLNLCWHANPGMRPEAVELIPEFASEENAELTQVMAARVKMAGLG